MPNPVALFTSVSSAGIGTAIGYISAAVIQSRSQRKTNAEDASVIVQAATELTDRLLKRNADLAHVNMEARKALSALIVAVQLAQDTFEDLPTEIPRNIKLMSVLQKALDKANSVEL